MGSKMIKGVKMGTTWTSYVAAAQGALAAAGFYDGDARKLMGDCGMGFHFIIHKEICESSATVYDWCSEHFMAMDRIGVATQVAMYEGSDGGPGMGTINTYALQHAAAIKRIKASLDEGRPVVVWAPSEILEFGIISGYDDGDGVFFVVDCIGAEGDPLLYENLGKSNVGMLAYQIFDGKVEVPRDRIVKASLNFGLSEWNKEHHMNSAYASGRRAYDNLIAALDARTWSDFGLAYLMAVYADAKECVADYLGALEGLSGNLSLAVKAERPYRMAATRIREIANLVPFKGKNGVGGLKVDRALGPRLAALAKEAQIAEEEAFKLIAAALEG